MLFLQISTYMYIFGSKIYIYEQHLQIHVVAAELYMLQDRMTDFIWLSCCDKCSYR